MLRVAAAGAVVLVAGSAVLGVAIERATAPLPARESASEGVRLDLLPATAPATEAPAEEAPVEEDAATATEVALACSDPDLAGPRAEFDSLVSAVKAERPEASVVYGVSPDGPAALVEDVVVSLRCTDATLVARAADGRDLAATVEAITGEIA